MDHIERIRQAEADSHAAVYMNHELFASGSWLAKPVKTVMELMPLFSNCRELGCLDLGCGVGRNSIPVARVFEGAECWVDCVDILPLAIEKLKIYAQLHGVADRIRGDISSIDDYEIMPAQYDLILAISALEHVRSEEVLRTKLVEIRNGVREKGIVCLIMNSGVTERDPVTGIRRTPQFEVNMETDRLLLILEQTFAGWDVVKRSVVHQQYEIPRGVETVELETDVVTWAVQK